MLGSVRRWIPHPVSLKSTYFSIILSFIAHVRWDPCHYGTACSQVADEGVLQIKREPRTSYNGWYSSLGFGCVANNLPCKISLSRNVSKGSVIYSYVVLVIKVSYQPYMYCILRATCSAHTILPRHSVLVCIFWPSAHVPSDLKTWAIACLKHLRVYVTTRADNLTKGKSLCVQ
jgi:hypothetical protein